MKDTLEYIKQNLPSKVQKFGISFLILGIALGLISYFVDIERAMFNYLLAFSFFASISVGALFLFALEYLVGAIWSVPIRRVVEFIASGVVILIFLAIPLVLNLEHVFEWMHTEFVENDKMLSGKAPYLNQSFFIIRLFIYCVLWSLFYLIMSRNSKKQDYNRDPKLTKRNAIISAVFMPVFAFTTSIFAIDWIMSIVPHWYSTIFGVYFFSGSVVGSLAAVTLATVLLKENGLLHPTLVKDHLYSLGALLFAFINFWAYIAFAQFMLIWYGNLPEETFWFMARWEGGWKFVSLGLIVIHFIVPYSLLLSQPAKMDAKRLKFSAVWILFAHLYDLYWLIMPSMHSEKSGFLYFLLELAFPIAFIGAMILIFYGNSKKYNLIPIGDPKLKRGLDFRL